MKTLLRLALVTVAATLAWLLASTSDKTAAAAPVASSSSYLKQPQTGGLSVKNISSLAFGPGGLLLIAEGGSSSVVAVETGDIAGNEKLRAKVENISAAIASGLGAAPGDITIRDLAVNPASGATYLAVMRRPDNAVTILRVNAEGKTTALNLQNLPWQRVSLPGVTTTKATSVTDVAFGGDRILAAGSCNEEFASKIFSIPLPLAPDTTASIYSAETYHVAHGKWETRAPISSFICEQQEGKSYVVGAFACTPIAKFPVDGLQSGAQVKGVSMVELGSGNRPLDMFTYSKGGKEWLVTHTQRFKQNLFGPSNFWGARVDMALLQPNSPDKTNEKAVRRDVKTSKDPQGIEVVDSLFGAVQADKLSDSEAVVLRDNAGTLSLEIAALP